MVQPGIVAVGHSRDGLVMRRVIAIAVAGASLGGCSSLPSSFSLDYFKPTPPVIQVQLESNPSGADAKTSLGPGCKTPCSVSVPAPDAGFSVTYALNRFQSATVPVQVIRNPGDFTTPPSTITDPSPVFVELQPAGPPPKGSHKPPMHKPKKPPKGAAAPAGSPFPDPGAAPPPGTTTTR
jgi:hypothetical protein